MGIAVVSYFVLCDDPQKAKWLNEEEKALCAARVKIDNVGMPKVIDSLSTKAMIEGMRNPTTLITSLIFLLDNIVRLEFRSFTRRDLLTETCASYRLFKVSGFSVSRDLSSPRNR